MLVTPLGFDLQRIPLSGSEERLTASLPLLPFIATPKSCDRDFRGFRTR
jgi:hypothetical protein